MAAGRKAQKGKRFLKNFVVTHRLHQNGKPSHTRPVRDERKVRKGLES